MGSVVEVGVCDAACGSVRVCACGEGGVVRGVKGGVGGSWGEDVAGMVYGVGVWWCVGCMCGVVLACACRCVCEV